MVSTYIASARAPTRYVGKCGPCGRPVSGTAGAAGDRVSLACPDCAGTVAGERVYGTLSRMECAGACMSAYGPSCECACGGVNHSARWSKAGTMLAGELQAYRARVAREAGKREARREGEQRRTRSRFEEWRTAHPALAAMLARPEDHGGFMLDMAWQVARGEPLSERQTEVAERIAGEITARAEREAAERAESRPVPAGKGIVITGEVVHTKLVDNYHAPHRDACTSKMLVKGDGWKIWATIPASIDDVNATTPGNLGGLRGKVVRFTADVAVSREDPSFGIAKRPRKAEILTPATV